MNKERNSDGTFATGNPGKPKGAKNKTTKELRELIRRIIDDNIEQLEEDLQKLEPRDRVRFNIDLLQFALPKLQSQKIEVDEANKEKPRPPINWVR